MTNNLKAMPNDSCPLKSEETIELLLDYTARKLDPVRSLALEQHMLVCADCALFREEQGAVWQAMDTWEPAPVSADFNSRLWRRIDEERDAPWYTKAGFRSLTAHLRAAAWKPAFPLAAAALVVCAGFLMDHPGSRPVPSPQREVNLSDVNRSDVNRSDVNRVTVSEADQLQRTLDDVQLLNQFDASADTDAVSRRM